MTSTTASGASSSYLRRSNSRGSLNNHDDPLLQDGIVTTMPTSASLYPVVQDLSEVETMSGFCCLDPDGSLNIGSFSFQGLSLLPLRDNNGEQDEQREEEGNTNSSTAADNTTTISSTTAVAEAAAHHEEEAVEPHESSDNNNNNEVHYRSRRILSNSASSSAAAASTNNNVSSSAPAAKMMMNDNNHHQQQRQLRHSRSIDASLDELAGSSSSNFRSTTATASSTTTKSHRRGFTLGMKRSNKRAGPSSDSLLEIHQGCCDDDDVAEALLLGNNNNITTTYNNNLGPPTPLGSSTATAPSSLSASRTSNNTGGATRWKPKTFEDQYVLTRLVFRCENSQVWETVHRESGQRYCVKIMEGGDDTEVHRLAAAHRSWGRGGGGGDGTGQAGGGGSPHIVQLVDTIHQMGDGSTGSNGHSGDAVYMVMEYVPGGNLLSRVVQRGAMNEDETRVAIQSILQGARHLHGRGMCHLDLQPSNVLMSSDGTCKICDFGSATMAGGGGDGRGVRRSHIKNLSLSAYAAPELMPGSGSASGQRQYITSQADMWSIGVMMHFCLFGCLPPLLEKRSGQQQPQPQRPSSSMRSSFSSQSPSSPSSPRSPSYYSGGNNTARPMISNSKTVTRAAKQLLSGLLNVDPTVRLTAAEALQHKFFVMDYDYLRSESMDAGAPTLPVDLDIQQGEEYNAIEAACSSPSSSSLRRSTFLSCLPKFRGRNKSKDKKNKGKGAAALLSSCSNDCSTTEETNTTTETDISFSHD